MALPEDMAAITTKLQAVYTVTKEDMALTVSIIEGNLKFKIRAVARNHDYVFDTAAETMAWLDFVIGDGSSTVTIFKQKRLASLEAQQAETAAKIAALEAELA